MKSKFKRAILHCDMNNFFASVECKINPSIKNLPVAVCGDEKERHGIVLAKNYIAKPYGIEVGDTVWNAKRKCKDLYIVSPPHYEEYEKYSHLAREIYRRFTDLVEPFGSDECWLDVTNSIKLFGEPEVIADKIRETIKKELGLTISVGVSFNKVFAKLGSDLKKPDATTIITEDNYKSIVWPLPASFMLGVGRNTKKVLDNYYVNTIGDIANEKVETLRYWLGKSGEMLYKYANGLDDSIVSKFDEIEEVKSVSHGITTTKDLKNNEEVYKIMISLSQEIAYKLRKKKLRAKVISVSVKDNELFTRQFQKKLDMPELSAINISKFAFELFKNRYDWENPVRTITISATNLIDEDEPIEIGLFNNKIKQEKKEKAEKCMEDINERFGDGIVKNAILMEEIYYPKSAKNINRGKNT